MAKQRTGRTGRAGKAGRPGSSGRTGPKSQQPPRRAPSKNEQKVVGFNACKAVFAARPDAILRAFLTDETAPRFGPLMKHCAENRLPYRVVPADEMQKVAASIHHEGICLVLKADKPPNLSDYLASAPRKDTVIALEGVGNPHNLGGITRTCAHFGVTAIWCDQPAALRSTAALRTAEGGAEKVQALVGETFWNGLKSFKKQGYTIVTTTSHKGKQVRDLYRTTFPDRMLLLLGSERHGLSNGALAFGDLAIRIPGSGNVESLNVACATSVILAERWRQRGERK